MIENRRYNGNSIFTKEIYRDIVGPILRHRKIAMNENLFSKIIGRINSLIGQNLYTKGKMVLPYHLVTVVPVARPAMFKRKGNMVINTHLVDWEKTNALWEEDPEMKASHVKVYWPKDYRIFMTMNKWRCTCRNAMYYLFRIRRGFFKKVDEQYEKGELELPYTVEDVWQSYKNRVN